MSDAIPTPDPAPGSAPAAPDWGAMVGSLPEDLRKGIEGTGVKDFASFAKHHVSVAQQVGKPRIPSAEERAKWTPEQTAAFHDQLGYPKEAKAYGLDEYRWTDEMVKAANHPMAAHSAALTNALVDRFAAFAAEKRIPREAARAAVEFYQGFHKDLDTVRSKARAENEPKLRAAHLAKYGGEVGFEKARGWATKGAEAVFGERFEMFRALELPDGTGVLDAPEFFEVLVQTGKSLEEGTIPGSRGAEGVTLEGAQEALNALMADPEKQKAMNDRSHPQHEDVLAERMRLMQRVRGAAPGDQALRNRVFGPQGLNSDGTIRSAG